MTTGQKALIKEFTAFNAQTADILNYITSNEEFGEGTMYAIDKLRDKMEHLRGTANKLHRVGELG